MNAPSFFNLLFVSILLVETVELAAVCDPGMYFSTFLGGCTPCKVNCDDQGNDAGACEAACVNTSTTKAVTRSTSGSTTEQPKEDVSTISDFTTQQPKEYVSTTEVNKIVATKTKPYNESTKGHKESDTSGLSDDQPAAIIVGIFVFIIVLVIIVVVYFWRFAQPPGANRRPVDEEERVEMCNEPSTSSGDASPNTKRLQNFEDKDLETVAVQESNKSPDSDSDDPYESCLHMQETQY